MRPVLRPDHERDVQHDEAVEQLRDRGRRGGAQPHEALAGHAQDAMEDHDVDELADEERDDGTADGPHALAEKDGVGLLDVGHAHARVDVDPERRGRQRDGGVRRQERVGDQPDRDPRDQAHAAHAVSTR